MWAIIISGLGLVDFVGSLVTFEFVCRVLVIGLGILINLRLCYEFIWFCFGVVFVLL